MKGSAPERVLALHATHRGFAYCVLDGPGTLSDWGIKYVGRGEKNVQCLRVIEHLVIRHDPHSIVFEDVTEAGGRRSARVKHLYRDIEK